MNGDVGAGTPGPGWYPDPSGRYELRYYDGRAWTSHVSTAGQQTVDAGPATSPPAAAYPYAANASPPGWMAAGGPPSAYAGTDPRAPMRVDLPGAVRRGLTGYADFSGRASRSEYWWWVLASFVAYVASAAVSGMSASIGAQELLITAVALGLFLPSLAVAVRRLHDTGRSGFWVLLGFIPIAGPIGLLVMMATAGTPQANRYGPPLR